MTEHAAANVVRDYFLRMAEIRGTGGRSLISAGPKIEIAAPYSDPDLMCRKS
jgi:hypothetical protein